MNIRKAPATSCLLHNDNDEEAKIGPASLYIAEGDLEWHKLTNLRDSSFRGKLNLPIGNAPFRVRPSLARKLEKLAELVSSLDVSRKLLVNAGWTPDASFTYGHREGRAADIELSPRAGSDSAREADAKKLKALAETIFPVVALFDARRQVHVSDLLTDMARLFISADREPKPETAKWKNVETSLRDEGWQGFLNNPTNHANRDFLVPKFGHPDVCVDLDELLLRSVRIRPINEEPTPRLGDMLLQTAAARGLTPRVRYAGSNAHEAGKVTLALIRHPFAQMSGDPPGPVTIETLETAILYRWSEFELGELFLPDKKPTKTGRRLSEIIDDLIRRPLHLKSLKDVNTTEPVTLPDPEQAAKFSVSCHFFDIYWRTKTAEGAIKADVDVPEFGRDDFDSMVLQSAVAVKTPRVTITFLGEDGKQVKEPSKFQVDLVSPYGDRLKPNAETYDQQDSIVYRGIRIEALDNLSWESVRLVNALQSHVSLTEILDAICGAIQPRPYWDWRGAGRIEVRSAPFVKPWTCCECFYPDLRLHEEELPVVRSSATRADRTNA